MARDYPEHDWRGIAMLTQQLGQLFEPSKTKLMSQQQEHEMNMLMAKQAWKVQYEQLELYKTQYQEITEEIEDFSLKFKGEGMDELINASSLDGAMGDQASEMFDKIEGGKLSDLQGLASTYQEKVRGQQKILDDFQLYDASSLMGERFSKEMVSDPSAKNQKEYDVLAETDKIPGLSYKEKQHALNMVLKDTGLVLKEGDEGYQNGIEQNIWNGTGYDTLRVKPEGVAFISGYNSTLDKEVRAATTRAQASAQAKDKQATLDDLIKRDAESHKMVRYEDMDPIELSDLFNQTQSTIKTLNAKYDPDDGPSIAEAMSYTDDGHYMLIEDATIYQDMDPNDIQAYISAHNNTTKIARAMSNKKIPVHLSLSLIGVKESKDMTQDFNNAVPGIQLNANQMHKQLMESNPNKKGFVDTVNTFNEFLRTYGNYSREQRLTFIKDLNNWLAK